MDRMLIVDDEPLIRAALKRTFAGRYELYFAADGEEALEQAFTCDPDVILLDVNMPKLDGRDVLAKLRDDERTKDAITIMVTARIDHYSRILGLELGAADYVDKPFDPVLLRRRVDRLLKKARQVN